MHIQRSILRVGILTLALASIVGCAGSMPEVIDQSRLLYVNPDLSASDVARDGLLVLPAVGRPGMELLAESLSDAMRTSLSGAGITFVSATDPADGLETASTMLSESYFVGGEPEPSCFDVLVDEARARFALALYVEDFGDLFAQTDPELLTTFSPTGQLTTTVTEVTRGRFGLFAMAEIWDAASGSVVWRRQCQSTVDRYESGDLRHEEYVVALARSLRESLPLPGSEAN